MLRNAPESGPLTRVRAAAQIILALCIGCGGVVQSANAEVHVSGTANDVTLEMRGASLGEVLQALGGAFKVQSRGTVGANLPINGTYSGSLELLLARLLDGHNFVMRRSGVGLEVMFFDPGGTAPTVQTLAPAKAGTEPLTLCQYNGVPIAC
jgi:hypothetical protein